jgi:glycosyltransferase involved in cell wall biosynthesis
MRIVHAHVEPRPVGGTETYLLALAEAQRAAGHDLLLAYPGVSPDRVAAFAPDVLHVHRSPFTAAADAELARRFPVVRSLHDYGFGCAAGHRYFRDGKICSRAHGAGCIGGILVRGCGHRHDVRPVLREYRAVGRRLPGLRAAAAVIAYSEYVRAVALANGVAAERCHVVPYFVSRPPAPEPLPERRTIAFAGRIEPDKGLDVLLAALALLPDAWDELLVAGDGSDRSRCEQLAAQAGISGRVRFAGWLAPAGLDDVLLQARVVVIPSRWPEPFGIAGLDALARGRPVVASAVGGITEWLEDGAVGRLVPAGDAAALAEAVASLLADPELARALGEEGWRRAERFSPERHLAALDEVYALASAEVEHA